MRPLAERCERARRWVSLELDDQLSEFERSFLTSHLAACGACRSFRHSVSVATRELRAASLERPEFGISLPRRARYASLRAVPVAAALLAAVGLGTAVADTIRSERARTASGVLVRQASALEEPAVAGALRTASGAARLIGVSTAPEGRRPHTRLS